MDSPLDWENCTDETIRDLRRLIQADTTNPPGNELPAILVVKDILDKNGFTENDYTIVESAPGRVNLIARLRGDGSQRPLLLSGHVDVVPVEREKWTCDPFGGEVADGCVWGRGALDMKGFLAMYLQVFLQIRRQNLPLKRDVILAAIADEEAGFIHGSRFLVEQHRSLIEAEYAFTEGGAFTVYLANRRLYPIQVAEKSVCWMRATTNGQPGHGSLPHEDNAVLHLAQALERLRKAGHLPLHVTPTFRKMLEAFASQMRFPVNSLVKLLGSPGLARLVVNRAPAQAKSLLIAFLSNTVTPTILNAGVKTNVIPSTAEAQLDCRLLPGQTPEDVIREITTITGKGLTLEPLATTTGTEFSTDTPLYRLLVKTTRQMDPEGITFPMILPGATDASQYQRAGITVYGFTPGVMPPDFPTIKLGHGHDERYPISAIQTGLPALWEVVTTFCAN